MSYLLTDQNKIGMITFTGVILISGISAVSLAYYRQKQYPPFKAKQLPAVALSLIAACFWSIGNLQSHSVFDLTNRVWAVCDFWLIW